VHVVFESPMSTESSQSCTLDEFRGFFLAKAYDVIGNGSYRKHLTKCKDSGDPWAVIMGAQLQAVQGHVRDIHNAVAAISTSPNNCLGDICRDVMLSAQPPIRLHAGCTTCSITGRKCMKCLDLSKTHKGHTHVYVDPRFCFFFMLLWFCNKLEYIIRSFTRTWLDSRNESETFKTLCCSLQMDLEPSIVKMHKLFVIAKDHVVETLGRHVESQKHQPILELPVA
jgi:hypothetical protein